MPKFDRVVLMEDDPVEVAQEGIVIPAIAQEKQKTATVLAVGPGVTGTVVGEHVIHSKYSGVEIEINRKKYLIVVEKELMGSLVPCGE